MKIKQYLKTLFQHRSVCIVPAHEASYCESLKETFICSVIHNLLAVNELNVLSLFLTGASFEAARNKCGNYFHDSFME